LTLAATLIGEAGWRTLFRRDALPWVAAVAVSTAVFQATFFYAVSRAGTALGATAARCCAPFATGAFSWWWLRQRPDWRWLARTAAAVIGCALVPAPAGGGRVDPVGVGTAVAYALFAWGLAGTTATTAGTLNLAGPYAGVALGALVLHEHLTVNAALGSLVLLSRLAVVAVPACRPRLPAPRAVPPARPLARHSSTSPVSDSS
jgi:drug/metabolite transporter (DMT)-like permease